MEEKKMESPAKATVGNADAQVAADPEETKGIDFAGLKTLAGENLAPDPWPKRFGWGCLELLIQLGLFLAGIVLDVLKALVQVVVGFFKGIYKGILAIGRFFRRWHRIFHEVDGAGKASFFVQGYGQFSYGQRVDGIIFFAIEVLFILFMVFFGVADIYNLVPKTINIYDVQTRTLTETVTCLASHGGNYWSNNRPNSVFILLRGLIAILIVIAYFIVYCKGINATYDDYQILHNLEFRQAHEDQLHVLRNRHHYTDLDFAHASRLKVRKTMRKRYGYSALSSRYVSYIPFKRIPERKANPLVRGYQALVAKFYARYDAWRTKIRQGKFSSLFAAYLDWKPAKKASIYGLDAVEKELKASLIKFHHTYDKYNNYLSYTRDTKAKVAVLAQRELVLQSIYAEDPVSVANKVPPVPHDSKIKKADIVSRLVGSFEIPLEMAREIASLLVKGLKNGEEGARNAIIEAHDEYQRSLDEFIDANRTKVLASVHGAEQAYADYDKLRLDYDQGQRVFLEELTKNYQCDLDDAKRVYGDYRLAIKASPDDAGAIKAQLAYRQGHFHKLVLLHETYPFHGQPIRFKREIRMYTDERFATTVLSLPVLGALATCVIPLVFSIIIAFTNYDRNNTAGYFSWSGEAFQQFFGANAMSGYSGAFMKLLGWTIIWAFFATFTNYIFGIILALLINKKGIKAKKMWRTIFVITIAIPQFITLLTMNLLLSDNGAVNGWLLQQGWYTAPGGLAQRLGFGYVEDGKWIATYFPFLSDSSHDAIWPKITLILVNMWIGIPYTMLSTSGILMNIPDDLYESARIDGANAWTQFWKITMPYVLFVTGPSLLTTFIGNINNFNVIYFLTGGGPTVSGTLSNAGAGTTDLLITWLYKLTVNKFDYSTASVIGLGVFVVCAFFSLIVYKRLGSTKNEEEFQ
jgi:arabinogalactan oligomer/maltooligosaccharide transport system permease protein